MTPKSPKIMRSPKSGKKGKRSSPKGDKSKSPKSRSKSPKRMASAKRVLLKPEHHVGTSTTEL